MTTRLMMATLAAAVSLSACGGRQSTLVDEGPAPQKAGDATTQLAAGDAAFALRSDKAKVNEAIKIWEEAQAVDGTDAQIPLKLTYAYFFLANAHIIWEDDEDALKVAYDKGVMAGERAIKLLSPDFAKMIKDGKTWEEAIPHVKREGLPGLYWYATNLGRWATLDGITTLLSNKDRIFAIMQHCEKLDETFFHGAPHRYFGVAYTKIPFPSGDLPKSRGEFEKAVAIAPTYADSKVLFAETYAAKAEDRALFKKLVEEVLALPDDVIPELVPETKNAKRKAAILLADIDDKF